MTDFFCYIDKNNTIGAPEYLPSLWRVPEIGAILNLKAYSVEELNGFGWYQYISNVIGPGEIVISSTKELSGNLVVETLQTRSYTEEELAQLSAAEIVEQWSGIREIRNNILEETDVHVVADKWEVMSSELKTLWIEYREALRNLPQAFSMPEDVIWPISPLSSES